MLLVQCRSGCGLLCGFIIHLCREILYVCRSSRYACTAHWLIPAGTHLSIFGEFRRIHWFSPGTARCFFSDDKYVSAGRKYTLRPYTLQNRYYNIETESDPGGHRAILIIFYTTSI